MGTETELKLLVSGDIRETLEQTLLPRLDASHQYTRRNLYNQYFDTPDRQLRCNDIGLRVRAQDGQFEQTVKTAGTSVGGLHQRPEYNIPIDNTHPDLTLFDPQIWPEDVSISRLQAQMQTLFNTDFTRHAYVLSFNNGDKIELVYDQGEIRCHEQSVAINEVELELVQGDPVRLFDVAEALCQVIPAQLGNQSKAARGYQLADKTTIKPQPLSGFLEIDEQFSCEQAFLLAISQALGLWQKNEACYLQSDKLKDLSGVYEGMGLMLQAITLYLPTMQCDSLLQLHKQLLDLYGRWYWLEKMLSIKELRSKRGPFRKKLANHDEVLSYLSGLSEGVSRENDAKQLIADKQNTLIQLGLSRLLFEKPWRKESSGYDNPVLEFAKGWLSQGWHNVLQSMPITKQMTSQDYIAQQSLLRQTMFNGYLLGKLFAERRDQFRAPWLDILDGIHELKTLTLLQQQLQHMDVPDKDDLQSWCQQKIANLLSVMEQSRAVGMKMEAYW